jgi:hypothetical protein
MIRLWKKIRNQEKKVEFSKNEMHDNYLLLKQKLSSPQAIGLAFATGIIMGILAPGHIRKKKDTHEEAVVSSVPEHKPKRKTLRPRVIERIFDIFALVSSISAMLGLLIRIRRRFRIF